MDQIKSKIEQEIASLYNLLENIDEMSRAKAFNHLSNVGDELMETALALLDQEVKAA